MRFCHVFGLVYIQKVLRLQNLSSKLIVFLYEFCTFVLISLPFHFVLFHSIYCNSKHSIQIIFNLIPEFAVQEKNALGLKIPFYFAPHLIMIFTFPSIAFHSIPFRWFHHLVGLVPEAEEEGWERQAGAGHHQAGAEEEGHHWRTQVQQKQNNVNVVIKPLNGHHLALVTVNPKRTRNKWQWSSTSWGSEWYLVMTFKGSLHRVFPCSAGGPGYDSRLIHISPGCSM